MRALFRDCRAFALLAAVSLLAACRGPAVVDHVELEDTLRTWLKGKGINIKSITCPVGRVAKRGDTFDCTFVDEDDQHLVFIILQEEKIVNWMPDGHVVNYAKIGHSVEKEVGEKAVVNCPDRAGIMKPGLWFGCDVDMDGKVHKLIYFLEDDGGQISWMIPS